ncbi:MAG TPA: DUF4037 domain-containing protein [Anaerolineaceae bacterium]|nr:DUF4037 domain-containing protein [Anaerolineaceae bacterium]
MFTTEPIALTDRGSIAGRRSPNNRTGPGPCDEWSDPETGAAVDLTYWDPAWVEDQIDRVLERYEASLGATTAFWNTILKAQILYDKNGWLGALKARCGRPYPEELRAQIIAVNHAMLRRSLPSHYNQIEKALGRDDPVAVHHRITALLASYFDVLFALNHSPHPGEKRLLATAAQLEKQPEAMEVDVRAVLRACPSPDEELLAALTRLLDRLDALLAQEGFDPRTSQQAG